MLRERERGTERGREREEERMSGEKNAIIVLNYTNALYDLNGSMI